jgi:hypothetical protein
MLTHAQLIRIVAIMALVLAVAACGKSDPEPTIVAIAPPAPILPDECRTAGDPKWTSPPPTNVRRRESTALWNRNAEAFADVAGRRRICEAGLDTQFPPSTAAQAAP